jgi:hypothetical protein
MFSFFRIFSIHFSFNWIAGGFILGNPASITSLSSMLSIGPVRPKGFVRKQPRLDCQKIQILLAIHRSARSMRNLCENGINNFPVFGM